MFAGRVRSGRWGAEIGYCRGKRGANEACGAGKERSSLQGERMEVKKTTRRVTSRGPIPRGLKCPCGRTAAFERSLEGHIPQFLQAPRDE